MIPKAILKPGITHISLSEEPLRFAPQIDWELVKKTCYMAARNYGGKFIQLSELSFGDNYRAIWFVHKYDSAKRILGMVNIYYPLIGFLLVDSRDFDQLDEHGIPERIKFEGGSFMNGTVFEDTDLTYWFSQSSYRVLNRYELNERLEFEEGTVVGKRKRQQTVTLNNLHELRLEDIHDLYHSPFRPKTVAEAIFGCFV